MLQKHTVSEPLLILLKDLQKDKVFKDFFLVGDTALSLQLGHRISVDIDLFTNNELNNYNKEFGINDTI